MTDQEELELLRLRKKKAMAGGGGMPSEPTVAEPAPVPAPGGFARTAGLAGRSVLEGLGGLLPTEGLKSAPFNLPMQALQSAATKIGEKVGVQVPAYMQAPSNIGETAATKMGLPQPETFGEKLGVGAGSLATGIAAPMSVPGVRAAVGKAGEAVRAPIARGIETLRGTKAAEAEAEALGATKQALGGITKELGATQAAKVGEAKSYEDVIARTQQDLDAATKRFGRPTLDVQGNVLRNAFTGSIDAAKAARAKETEGLYSAATEAAKKLEASGKRIDVSSATKDIEELIKKSGEIPALEGKLNSLLNSVKGGPKSTGPAAPIGTAAWRYGKAAPAEAPKGLTYEELATASRYIKDVAYSADIEGYGSIVRNAAKDLSKKLDSAIAKSVPEHAAASNKYRELSEPLESLGTRLGKALTSTEGGLKGEAYSKIAAQDLPGRIFAKKDGVELMVDALAGGKGATPAARAAAQRQVDRMVEDWVMESVRGGKGAVGKAAAEKIAAPQMQATLQAVPKVEQRLASRFEREATKGKAVEELGVAAKGARGEAEMVSSKRQAVMDDIKLAEDAATRGNDKLAYDLYVKAINKSLPDSATRQAAIGLVERAGTLREQTDKARALAKKFITGAALVGAGYEAKGLMQ